MHRDAAPQLREEAGNADRRRLGMLLRDAIVRGDFPDGRLPREFELMRDYSASRAVVRDVLNELKETGLVSREQGVGTYADIGSIFNLLHFHGVEGVPEQSTYPRVIDRSTIPTPPVMRARIPDCGPEVLRVEYIAVPFETAGAVSTNYFVLPQSEPLRDAEFGHNIYAFIENAGLRLSSSEFLLGAINADDYLARRLSTRPNAALLTLEQIMYDHRGDPLAFSTVAMRGDRVAFHSCAGERPSTHA